jgi:hypothetical protein
MPEGAKAATALSWINSLRGARMEYISNADFVKELVQTAEDINTDIVPIIQSIQWELTLDEVPSYTRAELELMGFDETLAWQMEEAYTDTSATVIMVIPDDYKPIFDNHSTDPLALAVIQAVHTVLDCHNIRFSCFQAHYFPPEPHTQESTEKYATTADIHNQAVSAGKSGSSDLILWKNLRFRSKQEALVAQELDRFGVLFLPNCKARLGYPDNRKNREPDFLVCHNGKWGILEVDHEYTHPESRTAEDHARDRLFRVQGIRVVEHYENIDSLEKAHEVVKEFLTILNQSYE